MKFTIKKVRLSEEQIEREKKFCEECGEFFLEEDAYQELIDFKCKKCNYETELEADIVFELWNAKFEPFPVLTCPKCGEESFIPKDITDKF